VGGAHEGECVFTQTAVEVDGDDPLAHPLTPILSYLLRYAIAPQKK